jgi:CRISPR/Cas system-associated exonuclease Cas4 (RecB family)
MSEASFSVTEVVTATRCPRQLVLSRKGHRVVPYGPDAFGTAAHVALQAIAIGAAEDAQLHVVLDSGLPDRDALNRALFRLALGAAHEHAKRVASSVDGGELARFSDTVKNIASLLTPPLAKAAATAESGRHAVAKVLLAAEDEVALELDGVTIRGRIDLLYRDGPEIFVWDLKTYAGSDLAQLEQVRLYAMAYAAKGLSVLPALVHVARDRIEISRADRPREGDRARLQTLVGHMHDWLDGAPPPAAPDLGTCRKCPAQSSCWRTWGRTLPDELDDVRGVVLSTEPTAPGEPPAGRSNAPPTAFEPARPRARPDELARVRALEPAPLLLGFDPKKVPVQLGPQEIVRHVAVFGAAGSGKTMLAKSIVEEAILAGIPVIAFDVQGDILQLAKALDDANVEPQYRARRDQYRERADVRLLTPMSDAGLRLSLNPLKFHSRDMPDEQAAVYSEAVAENLLAHVKLSAGWRNHASAYLADRVRGAMRKVDSLLIEDLIAGIAADAEVDDPLLDRSQRAKLVKELRLLTMGSKSYLFRVGRPLDLDALVTSADPRKTPLNVIWLNGLGDQQNKESFVAMVLADVYAWMLRQRGGAPRVVLYFDEVGPYMPPNGEPASKKLLKRIFKEGRKYGVCGLFATQNFTDVDYKVVSQASTVAIGRLNAAQEKKKAADALGAPPGFDVQSAVDKQLSSPVGRFIIKRLEGSPHWLQGRHLLTFHGGTWGEEEIRAHTSEAARVVWNGPVTDEEAPSD